jgi:glycosyltransferase involved in cell wall biosynthesis
MRPINTLFVIPQLERGGSETLIFNLARTLDRSNFLPSVAYLRSGGNESFIREFRQNNIDVLSITKKANIDFSLMKQLAQFVIDREIRIINAHHFISMVYSYYASRRSKKTGLIYTEHSSWEVEDTPLKWQVLGNYLLNNIDGVVGVTKEIAAAIQKKFFLKKSQVTSIENGVDLNRFKSGYNKQILRRNFGLGPDDKVIGMVANFRKVKNHVFLLKAFSRLLKENRGIKLMLVGRGFDNDPEGSEEDIKQFIQIIL